MKKQKFVIARHAAVSEDGNTNVVDECGSITQVHTLSSSGTATDRWFEINGQDLIEQEDGCLQQDYPPLRLRLLEPPAKS